MNDKTLLSVFHLCSDFARQALYPRLLNSIDAPDVRQFMYVPVRTAAEIGRGEITDNPSIDFRFTHILRPIHRILFREKIRRIVADVERSTPIKRYRMTHAHFLYSDGAVALELKRRHGLPYAVAIRNSDVNAFMRLRPDLALIRNEVLRQASRVVFLSPAYRTAVLRRLPKGLRAGIAAKSIIVPNGLSADWLMESPLEEEKHDDRPLKLLYVGDFTPNKNIAGILSALTHVRTQRPATLTIVGGGGDKAEEVELLLNRPELEGVNYLGRIAEPSKLREVYRSHDVFVMPSFYETFGLTYIEALSQGLPVVHSIGQGVDGYFEPESVAAGVDPHSPASIARGILDVSSRLPEVRRNCRREAARFDWSLIGENYRRMYSAILKEIS